MGFAAPSPSLRRNRFTTPRTGSVSLSLPFSAFAHRPAQQRLEGHHAARVEREDAQQLVLVGCEVHRAPRHRHPAPLVVDGERAEHERLGAGTAAQRRAHPGGELRVGEGLTT